jgi:hypothetical protein
MVIAYKTMGNYGGQRTQKVGKLDKSYELLSRCIYRALRILLKCPLSFSNDISHDYHMTYSLYTFYIS